MSKDKPKPSEIRQEVNGYTRILIMTPPFDRRHPDPRKDYGIGGMTIRMVLLKNNAAVQFYALTGQYLPWVAEEMFSKTNQRYNLFKGMGADVGYYSPSPRYDGRESMGCDLLEGGKCHYDGSGLRADEWFNEWIEHGNDWIWAKLETEWNGLFGVREENP